MTVGGLTFANSVGTVVCEGSGRSRPPTDYGGAAPHREAGLAVLVPDMRGFGDSDKPTGNDCYDARSLAEECRALVAAIAFGQGKPLVHAAHDWAVGRLWVTLRINEKEERP